MGIIDANNMRNGDMNLRDGDHWYDGNRFRDNVYPLVYIADAALVFFIVLASMYIIKMGWTFKKYVTK